MLLKYEKKKLYGLNFPWKYSPNFPWKYSMD